MDNQNDVMNGAFADDDDGCRSNDPYCARNPRSRGTYEAYHGDLCGACADAEEEEERARNTVEPGSDDDGDRAPLTDEEFEAAVAEGIDRGMEGALKGVLALVDGSYVASALDAHHRKLPALYAVHDKKFYWPRRYGDGPLLIYDNFDNRQDLGPFPDWMILSLAECYEGWPK